MSGHLKCRCDKPITDGAHLCAECVARVRDCLSKISERWEDLTDALASSEEGGEAGRQKGGMVSVGTNLNEAVSRARSLCSEILWFTVQVIREREAAEMRANRATADLDALESEDRRQDVQAKHWREVLRIRRELDGIRREMNDVTEIIAEALGYRPSGLPLDGWPHLSTTGDHTPTSLAAEAAGVLAKASRLRAGIEALAAEMQSITTPEKGQPA